MYESHFELDQRPFPATPLTSRYFPASAIEAARQTLARCLDRGEGAGLLVGPAGAGKTLLCYLLAEQFRGRFVPAMLFSGRLSTRRDLLQAILYELNLPYRGMEEGELRLSLIDFLTRGERCPHGMLLLIDEAHSLPLKLLEEVRMITNLVRNGQPRVRLVLSGGAALEERFASPKLESFSQRLAARCYLEPFTRGETAAYVRAQLAAVSGDADRIFSAEALEAVHRATDGVPRLINQLCDHALLLACEAGSRRIDARAVERAWAHLQQLPAPRGEAAPPLAVFGRGSASDRPGHVVEFGTLDDEPFAPLHIIDDLIVSSGVDDLDFADGPAALEVHDSTGENELETDTQQAADETTDLDEPSQSLAFPTEPETYESFPRYDFQSVMNEPEQPMLAEFSAFAAEEPEVELVFEDEAGEAPANADRDDGDADATGSPLWPNLLSADETQFLLEHRGPLVEKTQDDKQTTNDNLPELTDLPPIEETPWQFAEPDFVETAAAPSETWSNPDRCLAASEGFDLSSFDKIEICIETSVESSTAHAINENSNEAEQAEEELVIDRYATAEVQRGTNPGGQALATAPATLSSAQERYGVAERTERTLSMAESLVRRATAVEQVGLAMPELDEFGSVLAAQEPLTWDLPGGWLCVDLLPAASETPTCATSETIVGEAAMESCEPRSSIAPASTGAELELIVVEDDPVSAAPVVLEVPAAAPVRRQEYKQLFAKLRKS